MTTTDPEWLEKSSRFWEERYNQQHDYVHALEDELGRLRKAAQALVTRLDLGIVRVDAQVDALRTALDPTDEP